MGRDWHRIRSYALTVSAISLLSGCSNPDPGSAACEQAAIAQTQAEMLLGELLGEHEVIHAQGGDHDLSAAEIAGARVEVILTEAEARKQCG